VKDGVSRYEQRVGAIARTGADADLRKGLIGLEKEALRVSHSGTISAEPHPAAFGSALTHPCITTDFSEALLELITPALPSGAGALAFLGDLHAFVHEHLRGELLWAASMPCVLDGARSIPLARYGTSNAGLMKTVYRRGLGNRYGRVMQVIAGVHYNFSFADDFWSAFRELEGGGEDALHFRSEGYMALVRNLQRFGWLIPYLFGASPAVCKSFIQGSPTDLEELDAATYYYPYATSLRMGDIGYQNRQTEGAGMKASYDSLDAYIRSLTWAIETPCPFYEGIGVKVGDRYEQLNANVLQIENEYYSTVRPKQPLEGFEKPTLALRRRGVRYVEVRSLDVDAFEPLGVSGDQLRFLDTFARFCLLWESPRISPRERRAIDDNQVLAAQRGRDPGLELERHGRGISLRSWALELLEAMEPMAELMDGGGAGVHRRALLSQREKVLEPDLTPSARMIAEMRANKEGFFHFARRVSETHRDHFLGRQIDPDRRAHLERLSAESLSRQAAIESGDSVGFDEFLDRYFSQTEPSPAYG
jgi:glutamate--cysteine ligase